jgi:hypothetical protein
LLPPPLRARGSPALRPEQALERGIRFNPDGIEYVPCRILHDATLTHRESEHLLNIRALQ